MAILAVDGTAYREIFKSPLNSVRNFRWVKNGKAILFGKQDDSDGTKFRIMVLTVDGRAAEFSGLEVRNFPGGGLDLSRDGSRLAVSSARTAYEIWALDNLGKALNLR